MEQQGLTYWYKEGPANSKQLPLIFFHGITPGILAYIKVRRWKDMSLIQQGNGRGADNPCVFLTFAFLLPFSSSLIISVVAGLGCRKDSGATRITSNCYGVRNLGTTH